MESVAFAGMLTGAIVVGIFVLLFLGVSIAGIACLVIYAKNDSRGKDPSAVLPVISAVLFGISGFFLMYIYVFLVFGMAVGFAESVISHNSEYQVIDSFGDDYEYFTVNGERYDLLELTPNYDVCSEIGVVRYLEELDGEYCTYYYIPNEEDFDLVFDGCMYMYAPTYQHDDIYREYADEYGDLWIMYGDDLMEGFTKLPEDASDTLTRLAGDISEDSIRLIRLDDPKFTNLSLPSEDGIFSLIEMVAVSDSGKIYILTGFGMGDNEYYLYEIPFSAAAKLSVLK